jgi:hypothetical protein
MLADAAIRIPEIPCFSTNRRATWPG